MVFALLFSLSPLLKSHDDVPDVKRVSDSLCLPFAQALFVIVPRLWNYMKP